MANWSAPGTYALNAAVTSADIQARIITNLQALGPVGLYSYQFATPQASRAENLINACWLECNGAAVSRTTYPDLFTLIGTTYGTGLGDGLTFSLPDLSGRTPVSAASGGHTDVNALGKSDGQAVGARSARHKHSFAETAHNHTGSAATGSNPGDHTHGYLLPSTNSSGGDFGGSNPELSGYTLFVTTAAGAHSHSMVATISVNSGGVTVDPGGSRPVDGGGWLVAGIWCIKGVL